MGKKILIVAAHPDDEVLGCFATVSKLVKDGAEAYTLILGEGKTARESDNAEQELELLGGEIQKANERIGVKKVFTRNFPDNKFDTVALLDLVKAVLEVKEEVQPDIIFTHFKNDLNIDHRITYEAVITATRPMAGECVKEIYSFEVLSATEWNYPLSFSPDTFFDVSQTLGNKIDAMELYASELCEYPHPRSLEGIELQAAHRGMQCGIRYAEAFECVRAIK